MSDDNVIPFPGLKKKDKQFQKESNIKEEGRALSSFEEDVIPFPCSRKTGLSLMNEYQKESATVSGENSTFSEERKKPDKSNVIHSRDTKENDKKSQYTFTSVACALCLMLVGFPFLNQYSQGPDRGLASADQEEEKVRLREEEESRRLQEERALNLIQTGQRKIASIGERPEVRDVFSIELLKSRYNVRWSRGKLVYAVLLKNQDPVDVVATDKIVDQYSSLFPSHTSIRKLDSLSGDLEIYELQNAEGLNAAQVETLKDVEGKLLSIHVAW